MSYAGIKDDSYAEFTEKLDAQKQAAVHAAFDALTDVMASGPHPERVRAAELVLAASHVGRVGMNTLETRAVK